jgi:hypothetical protein
MSTPLVRKSTQSIEPKTETKKTSLGFLEEKEILNCFEVNTIEMETLLAKEIGDYSIKVNDMRNIRYVQCSSDDINITVFVKGLKDNSFTLHVINNNDFDVSWKLKYITFF